MLQTLVIGLDTPFASAALRALEPLGAVQRASAAAAVDALRARPFDLVVAADADSIALLTSAADAARTRAKLDAIDAAGRELVALHLEAGATMSVPERLALLEERLIRFCHDLLEFSHFNVLVLDPATQRLDFVISGGFSEESTRIEIYARPTGNGISGYVAATGTSYICPDITADPLYMPGIPHAASSLTVPLRLIGRTVGVLNVESDKPAAFNDEDRQFAEILGRYAAVALHTLKLLVSERSEAVGQVTAEVLSGAAEPLDDIVADVSRVLEGAILTPDARDRLQAVLRHVDRVKLRLHSATDSAPIRGFSSGGVAHDPLLDGKRVLIADDEVIIRETVAEYLAKAGALPVTARDGDDALAIIRAQPFDLVLTDIKMPHRNGYEVFAAAKAANPGAPVILITGFGYDPEHNIVRASREGLSDVLFKPFKIEQLVDIIHKALAPRPAP